MAITTAKALWKNRQYITLPKIDRKKLYSQAPSNNDELTRFVFFVDFYRKQFILYLMNDHSIGVNEYNLPVIIRGNVRIEWVNLGEGQDGDYDPTDECDKNILRFDVSRFDGKDWEAISDGSYCTQVEANTAHENLIEHLVHFMGEIYDDVSEHGTAKRVCESLSWTK